MAGHTRWVPLFSVTKPYSIMATVTTMILPLTQQLVVRGEPFFSLVLTMTPFTATTAVENPGRACMTMRCVRGTFSYQIPFPRLSFHSWVDRNS